MEKKFPYYDSAIPVEQLILDTNNPRLPDYMRGQGEQEIIDYMVLQESTLELMQAIGEKGFFPGEQLLVVKQDENYLVVEGNRRLTAVKLLNDPEIAEAQSTIVKKVHEQSKEEHRNIPSLPCMVFESEAGIHDYLGYRHVTGIQPWNLRQKAQYLNYLKEKNFKDLAIEDASEEIRKVIGSKRDYVKRILVGYEVFTVIKDRKFFNVSGLTSESFYFSYIADSLRQPNICNFLGVNMESENPAENLNIESLKYWTEWLFQPIERQGRTTTRLKGKSTDLNMLNAVLGKKSARHQFIEKDANLEVAFAYTEDFHKGFKDAISNSIIELQRADNILPNLDEKGFYPSLVDDLVMIIKLARSIKAQKDEFTDKPFEGDELN